MSPSQGLPDGSADLDYLQAEISANEHASHSVDTLKPRFTDEQLQEAASFAAEATRGSSGRRSRTELTKQAPPLRSYIPQSWKQQIHGANRRAKTLADVSRQVKQQAPKRTHAEPTLMHRGDTAITAKPASISSLTKGVVPPHLRHRVQLNAQAKSHSPTSADEVVTQSHNQTSVSVPQVSLPPPLDHPASASTTGEDPNLTAEKCGSSVRADPAPSCCTAVDCAEQEITTVQEVLDSAALTEHKTPRISMTIEKLKSLNMTVGARHPKGRLMYSGVLRPSQLLASAFERVEEDVPLSESPICQLRDPSDTNGETMNKEAALRSDAAYPASDHDARESTVKAREEVSPDAAFHQVSKFIAILPEQTIAIQRAANKRANERQDMCARRSSSLPSNEEECGQLPNQYTHHATNLETDNTGTSSIHQNGNHEGSTAQAGNSDTGERILKAPSVILNNRRSSTLSAIAPSFFAPGVPPVSSGPDKYGDERYPRSTSSTSPAEWTSDSAQSAFTIFPQPIQPSISSYIPTLPSHLDDTATFAWDNPLFQDVTHSARTHTVAMLPADHINDPRTDSMFTTPGPYFQTTNTNRATHLTSSIVPSRTSPDVIMDTKPLLGYTSSANVLSQLPLLDGRFTVVSSLFNLERESGRPHGGWEVQDPVVREAMVPPTIHTKTVSVTTKTEVLSANNPTNIANKVSCKKQRRQARADLTDAWREREDIRKRVAATWTLDGARALEGATAIYNATRTLLAQSMSNSELTEEDSRTFPQLGKADLSAPRVRPNGRPREFTERSTSTTNNASLRESKGCNKKKHKTLTDINRSNGTSNMNRAVRAILCSGSMEELASVAIEARQKYLEAHEYFERPPPQGRAKLRDLRAQGEKRIELAAKRYRDKIRAVEDAYGGNVPEKLRAEFWWVDDQYKKKLRDMWNL